MGPRAGLELREDVADVALDRLFREEEALADLAVHEAVADELEHFDLAGGRFLLRNLRPGGHRDHLGNRHPPGRDLLEAPRVLLVAGKDLGALCSVHCTGYRPPARGALARTGHMRTTRLRRRRSDSGSR